MNAARFAAALLALLGACGPATSTLPDAGSGLPVDGGQRSRSDGGLVDGGTAATLTTLRVHYPVGTRTPYLRGSRAPLSWTRGLPMQRVDADLWQLTLSAGDEALEIKPLLDDADWAKGPNWVAAPGANVDMYPRFVRDVGEVRLEWPAVASSTLGNTRAVWVYVPPTALENTTYRAPVVYMHDGRNLFDDAIAFGGTSWSVDEAMNAGAADGTIAEAIVVGIEATSARLPEYTPTASAPYGGGNGDAYLRFVEDEVRPRVAQAFRISELPRDTAIVGSSLGGLISAYAGVTRGTVFGLVGALSPSTWWDNRVIVGRVQATPASPARPLKVYVDSGDSGLENDDVDNTRALAEAYRQAGYVDGVSLRHLVQPGASHTERYWAERLPGALRFLLGPRR